MRGMKMQSELAQANYNISEWLSKPNGLEKIAQDIMPGYIKETRDYEGFARKVLRVDPVAPDKMIHIDSEPYVQYNKDFNSHAAIYADDAQVPMLKVEGSQVNVGIITLSSDDVTITEKRLITQKFDYIDRLKSLSAQVMMIMEDTRVLNMVELLIKGSGTNTAPSNKDRVVTTPDTLLSKEHLVLLKKKFSEMDIPMSKVVFNAARLDDILAWTSSGDRGEIDPQTQREMLETGVRTNIWGDVQFITSRIVDINNVYAFSSEEYTGFMPILKDVTVRLTATDNKLQSGLFLYEFLGFYLASHRAIAKLVLEFSDGDPIVLDYDEENVKTKMLGKEIEDLGGK